MQSDGGVPMHVLEAYGAADAEIVLLTGGRTNRTMRVRSGHELVLQHLRATETCDLLAVMENLVRVTSHLDWKHRVEAIETGAAAQTWWPELVPTVGRKPFMMDEDRNVWRAFTYRAGRIARSAVPAPSLASAAELFGRFARATGDIDDPPLLPSNPDFHDLDSIWDGFIGDLDEGLAGAADLASERGRIAALHDRLAARIADDGLAEVRERVVHNDTKLANVLLHETSSDATAVLDLDLVMMGPIWHDVGDLLRSSAWHAGDDAPRLSENLFGMVAAAFAKGAGDSLSDAELSTFATAGPRLAFELGLRYLQDHMRAEPVLQVTTDGGHRGRGLANLMLAEEMLNAYDALRSVVDDLIARR